MILEFYISNYKSIKECTVDFQYTRRAPKNFRDMERAFFFQEKQYRAVPVMVMYGANASGKSTVIDALSTFVDIVEAEVTDFQPNKILNCGSTTCFKIKFVADGALYEYLIEYNEQGINAEKLAYGNDILYEIDFVQKTYNIKNVVPEVFPESEIIEKYELSCHDDDYPFPFKTFLGFLGDDHPLFNVQTTRAYRFLSEEIFVFSRNNLGPTNALRMLAESNDNEGIQLAFDSINVLLRKLDIAIEGMELEQNSEIEYTNRMFPRRRRDKIYTYHLNEKKERVKFDFLDESDGTQRLFSIIAMLLKAQKKGAVLVVDELDCSVHPMLLHTLVEMHTSQTYNSTHSQLFFSAHTMDLLEDNFLKSTEVSVVTKYGKLGTKVARISDIPDISHIKDFRRAYMNGEFSGIPYPYI